MRFVNLNCEQPHFAFFFTFILFYFPIFMNSYLFCVCCISVVHWSLYGNVIIMLLQWVKEELPFIYIIWPLTCPLITWGTRIITATSTTTTASVTAYLLPPGRVSGGGGKICMARSVGVTISTAASPGLSAELLLAVGGQAGKGRSTWDSLRAGGKRAGKGE